MDDEARKRLIRSRLKQQNGGSVRLPSAELEARLEKHSAENCGGRG